jgi:hypothetical protein
MFDYEFGQAGGNLDEIKEKLKEYLINSYHENNKNPQEHTDRTFKYLESLVDRIIKRKDYKLQFGSGGSPHWHANIFRYVAKWVDAELKMCEMLSKELNSKLDD